MEYDFIEIESKWQKKWEHNKLFEVKENYKKEKFYCLEMFPYPSGEGLHMGHALNYTIGDIYARFKRMNGFNVLYPVGYDSFGLPAENAAIKAGEHPKKYTENSIKNFIKQQRALGLSYDWSRMIKTSDIKYYKWNQFFFLKFLEKGLIYRKKSPVNWCSKCDTVLANEQVHNGRCWRHGDTEVKIKQLEQWFIKTTAYADEILSHTDKLQWPERIKTMQKNWIGKSYGIEIHFEINGKKWPIFTTRPDTIYGVTFMVVSAQHPKLQELVTDKQKEDVQKFLKKIKSVIEKQVDGLGKEGIFTGSYAVNPLTKEKIPVYAGNFVVADYGSGMVMSVPAHDQRDFAFAKKYNIPIKFVIQPENKFESEKFARAYTGEGILVNSEDFNGLKNKEAVNKITQYLEKKKLGKKLVQYKLRDWLVSRQRYWGTPIPIVYCEKCGAVPVPEKELPIILPESVKFGKGNPLTTNKNFIETNCPKCNAKSKRETDTMDTFFDSSWYYLRYCDPRNDKDAFNKKKAEYWMPVDQYIGGAEHACMHLIYARFFAKALRDLGFVKFDEPFMKLFNQGMLHATDGQKMSKSLGNVINPINIIGKYGADSLRLSLMSFASPDKDTNWDEKVLAGSYKFVNKAVNYFESVKIGKSDRKTESKLNKTIKEVTDQIENFKYSLAIIKIRDLFNSLPEETSKEVLEKSLKLLHPFCPHITEEIWNKIGNKGFISAENWPEADLKKIDENLEREEHAVEKLSEDIHNIIKLIREKGDEVNKIFIYTLPNEKQAYANNLDLIKKKIGVDVEIYAVNDKDKYDPENKSKKVKPGRPGIYAE